MKHDYKKQEKTYYQPKEVPEFVTVPTFKFFILSGQGDPNSPGFADYIEALYGAAYTVKMSYKSPQPPAGFEDYTVYPLEGVWDLIDPSKGLADKSNLKFDLMIRQPDFLTEEEAAFWLDQAFKKKKNALIKDIRFEEISEGQCVQMLHVGSYDDEPASFARMETYCDENGLVRVSKIHREIYLSDARKTEAAKLKTILRVSVRFGYIWRNTTSSLSSNWLMASRATDALSRAISSSMACICS